MKTLRELGVLVAALALSFTILQSGILTGIIDDYTLQILCVAGINIIIALSLNLISGFTGQLALGHAGFMAVGAYGAGVLLTMFQWPLWAGILGGTFLSGLFGLLIGMPTLRLRGDYLAIVTLGFGEIIRVLVINLGDITGGSGGLKNIPMFDANIMVNNPAAFLWIFPGVAATVILISNLIRSSHGRTLKAIREDEIAAQAMGVSIFGMKLTSFTISALLAGLGGALYAPLMGYLSPGSFDFLKSVFFVIIVVLGGMGSITGTIIAGVGLTFLQEALRSNAKDWGAAVFGIFTGGQSTAFDLNALSQVLFGLTLVLLMIFRPAGLMGTNEFSLVRIIGKIGAKKSRGVEK